MKVYLDSVGCRLNQSEIERMAHHLRWAGHQLASTPEGSDLVVINTCAVTAAAAADSRRKVRRAHRSNHQAEIILTGCWSDLEPEAAEALPGVAKVIPNDKKDTFIPDMIGLAPSDTDWKLLERRPIPGGRRRTRAFIKVQDGCDNHCTYCLPKIARGQSRSRSIEDTIAEIRSATAGSIKEVVLTGAQLSAYGRDLPGDVDLTSLLGAILDQTSIPRIRLSSMEPWGLPSGLFDIFTNPRLCRQLHLPLQSGCGKTLRRMGRPILPKEFAQIVLEARQEIPGLAITTDIMVGFPGETECEFEESLAFIKSMNFAGAHVFVYSPRPGTAAINLPNAVPHHVARQRSYEVREATSISADEFRAMFLGGTLTVLWESASRVESRDCLLSGWSDNYIRVCAMGPPELRNQLSQVNIMRADGKRVIGEVVKKANDPL